MPSLPDAHIRFGGKLVYAPYATDSSAVVFDILALVEDTRNVMDKYKGLPMEAIVADLDEHGVSLEIAIENLLRDFNMGTIVRSANAFGVRHVHVIGRRQWNKRGAMMTDKYIHVHYYESVMEFAEAMRDKAVIAIDNVPGAVKLSGSAMPNNTVLAFGSEGEGLSCEMLAAAQEVREIPQYGSTRSLNVGVAAGIAMYAWLEQNGYS